MRRINLLWLVGLFLLVGCQAVVGREGDGLDTAVPSAPISETSASVQVDLVPAAELPDQPADISGGFLSQEGGQIKVGSGFVDISPDGAGSYRTKHDGPLVAVQTNDQTRFWADVTQTAQASGGAITAQQEVKAMTPPVSIPYPAFISVWGQWQDDVFLADDVLFDVPGD